MKVPLPTREPNKAADFFSTRYEFPINSLCVFSFQINAIKTVNLQIILLPIDVAISSLIVLS
jgi:hypothetical protein